MLVIALSQYSEVAEAGFGAPYAFELLVEVGLLSFCSLCCSAVFR